MKAKMVVIGDSLAQGFQHGAIRRSEWSYPAMIARTLGAELAQPDFSGNGDGGPLLDLELLANSLSRGFGTRLAWWELPGALLSVRSFMDRVEDYWEREGGTRKSTTGPVHHNLAVWGFEVLDALTLSEGVCRRNTTSPKDQFVSQLPEFAMYRTARRVFNPSQDPALEELTQLDLAEKIARDRGIENLVLALGANNALATCLALKLRWSQSADFRKLPHQRNCTIWEPEHFAKIYDRLVERVKKMKPERIFVGTVPHVTIAPVARGVSPLAKRRGTPELVDGYYEYYGHFWVWDRDFDPETDERIAREDARAVDAAIDEYNDHIRKVAKDAGWHVVEFCQSLDALAFRRTRGAPTYTFPRELVAALRKNPATAFRVRADDQVLLDTRYFRVGEAPLPGAPWKDWQEAFKGGLFGLDGVHPTTIGYGLMAHETLAVMESVGVPGAAPGRLPWDAIVEADTLVTRPPAILSSLQDTLSFLFGTAKLDKLVKGLSGYGSQPDGD